MNQSMKANNQISTRIPRLASWVASIGFALAMLMPLLVALFALGRSYDAVPDQDLIWVSDALKLFREIQPRYMDHPGSYWPLSTAFKLDVLGPDGLGLLALKPGQLISPAQTSQLIVWNRIEQGVVCSVLGLVFWWLARLVLKRLWLSSLIAACFSLSYGVLFEAVQPRNESTSMLFVLLFCCLTIGAFQARDDFQSTSWKRWLACLLAVIALFASLYCKLQVVPLALLALLILPFAFGFRPAAVLASSKASRLQVIGMVAIGFVSTGLVYALGSQQWLMNLPSIFYGAEAWKGISYESLIALPFLFWPAVFLLLALVCHCAAPWFKARLWLSYSIWLSIVWFVYLSFLAWVPENWSKHVFTAPLSLLWRSELYARDVDMVAPFAQISIWPLDWAVTMSVGLFVSMLALAVVLKQSKPLVLLVFWALAVVVFAYNTTRFQPFYSIYFLPPLLLALAAIVEWRPTRSASGKSAQALTRASHALACLLIGGIGIQSLVGLGQLPQTVSFTQSPVVLCMQRQSMDILLANTSVGGCQDFQILKLD